MGAIELPNFGPRVRNVCEGCAAPVAPFVLATG
jgi:hypothetical protein